MNEPMNKRIKGMQSKLLFMEEKQENKKENKTKTKKTNKKNETCL
jgi:hypothetical protein